MGVPPESPLESLELRRTPRGLSLVRRANVASCRANPLDKQGISGRGRKRKVACHGIEVGIAQFDSDRSTDVAFTSQVVGNLRTELRKDSREGRPIVPRMQITLERSLATDRLRCRAHNNRSLVASVRCLRKPLGITAAEMLLLRAEICNRQVADCRDNESRQLRSHFRSDSIYLAHRKRPDSQRNIRRSEQGEAVRLVELGANCRVSPLVKNASLILGRFFRQSGTERPACATKSERSVVHCRSK